MTARLDDWDRLSAEWRAQPRMGDEPAGDVARRLRERVRRHTRLQWLILAGEIALTIVFVLVVRSLLAAPGGRGLVPAVAIVAMIVLVWSFALWNRRGSWRPLGESTAEYIRLSRVRARAGRRTVRFTRVVLVLALAGYVPWFAVRLRDGALVSAEWWRWTLLAATYAVYLGWCSWYGRRLDREIEMLREIESEPTDVA